MGLKKFGKKLKKGIKKVAKVGAKVAPLAAAFIPGVGPIAAAGIGAGLSKIGGASWGDSLGSGLMTGLGSGMGNLARGGQFMGAGGSGFSLGSMFGGGATPGINPQEAFRMSELGQTPIGSNSGGIDWGSAFDSFLGGGQQQGLMPGQQPTNMDPWRAGFGALGNLYQGYKQGQDLDNQRDTIDSLYGFDSPYAQQMRQRLERKDAAAGRRSQYGTREVELMGDLAGKRASLLGAENQIGQMQDANRGRTIGGTLGYGNMSGFIPAAGRGLQNLYNQYTQ